MKDNTLETSSGEIMDSCNSKSTNTKELSKWRKNCAILGSFLLIIPSGIYSMWGSISVYALSYVYTRHGMSMGIRTPWEVSAYLLAMYVGYNTTGYLFKCCHKQVVLFLIILVSNGGYFAAYLALTYDVIPLAVGVVFVLGFSIGVVESAVFKYIADWSGSKKGYLISIACSGMNFGPFLVNPIVTAYVNYGNLSPDVSDGGLKFITQKVVMEKVPSLFLVLGSMFLGIQIVGFLLLNLHEHAGKPTVTSGKNNYGSVSTEKKQNEETGVCEMETNKCADATMTSLSPTRETNNTTTTTGDASGMCREGEGGDLKPSQVLCCSIFYILWLCNACRDCSTILLNSYYKSFGQNWIHDDYMLTAVGSVLGITGGFVRLTWGFILDRYNLKSCLIFVFSSVTSSMMFMYYTPSISKWLYFAVTVFYASIHSCLFPTVVSSTLALFGQTHFNHNLGLVNTASMVSDIVAPLVFEALLSHSGWFWIFGSTATLFTITLVTIVVKFPYTRKKKDVQSSKQ